jgi:uncharacterized protein (DUF58 family)
MAWLARSSPRSDPSARPPVRRYHFHLPGVMYIAVTLFLALGAINSQNNLLFCSLGLAIGGLLVSGILSGSALMGLRLERRPPKHTSVGRATAIRYDLSNRNRLVPAFGLTIEDLPVADAGRRPTWPGLLPAPRTFIAAAPAGRTVHGTATIVPVRRGKADLVGVRAWTTFPFGLARKSVTFHLPQTLLVLPPELTLRPGVIDHLTARSPHGVGGERSPGMGDEFFGLREYVPGDSPRRIAWRRTARTGDLVVRQNTTPSPLRLWVLVSLDRRKGPRVGLAAGAAQVESPTPPMHILDERAIALAAAILRNAADQDIAVGLAVPSGRLLHPPRLGRFHLDRLLTELALLDLPAMRRSDPAAFPDPVARSGACVIVHAADVDRSLGPRHAHHLRAADLHRLVEDSAHNRALIGLIDAAPLPRARRRWPLVQRIPGTAA